MKPTAFDMTQLSALHDRFSGMAASPSALTRAAVILANSPADALSQLAMMDDCPVLQGAANRILRQRQHTAA